MLVFKAIKNGKVRTISVPTRFLHRLGQWIDGDGNLKGYKDIIAYLTHYGYSDIKRFK